MDIWYWISEYGKVFLGYLFLMFLWPSVVFRSHLRGKSKEYYFSFCVTAPIIIINTVVLMLGLFHILSQRLICWIFYGIFILSFLRNLILCCNKKELSYKQLKRTAVLLCAEVTRRIRLCSWLVVRVRFKEKIYCFGQTISTLFWKYGVLGAVIIYGMIYFSYGAFQIYSYGYGDLYVHHGWIYGLIEGKIFQDGVYPEAMHCFVYCMHTLFGIQVYSILLFLQVIHVMILFIAVYLLLRRIFCWRYTPVFVLMLFLTVDLYNADSIHSMFRLQITLPLEFGLHTVFLCALNLFGYFHEKHKDTKLYWSESLFMYILTLMTAVMIHFHAALMALLFCIAVIIFVWKKIFNKKYLIPFIFSTFCACLIALLPMAGALAEGVPFNSSVYWAVNAMDGEESREMRTQKEDTEDTVEESESPIHIERSEISITASILGGISGSYEQGYCALYGKERGGWVLLFTLFAAAFCWQIKRRSSLKKFRKLCKGYPFVIAASVIYVLLYAAPTLGFPDIIPEGRFFVPGHIMVLAVMAMPFDLVVFSLARFFNDLSLRILSLLSVLGVYGLSIATGSFRGFLFYELSRYNSAAMVTDSIISTFPHHSYTIVSPTDELYPVIQYGWHEELLRFVEKCSEENYVIPSEYVFIYVEKKPLLYAQSHFFQGPSWLGEEKYLEPFWKMYSVKYPDNEASQAPEIIAGQVSEEAADRDLPEYENAWSMYLQLENRTIIESKAYDWCQKFSEKHPSVLDVYYEDDSFVCYYFRQNAGEQLYELGIKGME